MRTTMISIAFAALGQLSVALPALGQQSAEVSEVAARSNVARAITHLFVCDSLNFQGRCENLETETNRCYNLFNNWNDVISSLGPDQGTTCTIYENFDCQGRSVGGIVNPGLFNLNEWNFNDITSSYRCS
ncbi:hypothetical protein B0H67DRAFT_144409 [Lasiosphaeris hirsuta]|uniref:Uncharacterized protein n=1 Tax=Lasiosphaeris hirsuta TaxID=260670 RepID=A0AA40B1N6_9PEZI|nr:hypothetical protein B0H67DRAFT_144409 [Lasiosphaeris hirsuta]